MTDLGFAMPAGACDCHMHVFGDPARYPPAALRAYDPTEATLAQWRAMATPLGLQRVVLVQPSAYGADNACMLDALRHEAGRDGFLRAVAVIDAGVTDAALDEMHALGVRGIRLNLVSNGIPDPAAATLQLRNAAARVARLGWHVQMFLPGDLLAALAPAIRTLPVPVVVDHMGGARAALGLQQPGLPELCALLAEGRVWVKVSGINRVSDQPRGFRDGLAVMRALVAANPQRLVWGSDWPHIGPHEVGAPRRVVYMDHDNADLLRALGEAVPDAAMRDAILAGNPARLYGFGT